MSLILDALKKSEAERQLGRAPGLTTPMPLRRDETEEHVRPWLRYAVWLAVVGVAIAAVWWLARGTAAEVSVTDEFHAASPPITSTATGPDEASTQSGTVVATVPASAESEANRETTDTRRKTAPPEPVAVAPALEDAPRDVEASVPKPRDPEFDTVERETQAIIAPAQLPAPSAPTQPAPAAATPAPPPAPVAGTQAPLAVETSPEALPRLDQLGGPQRDSLPPLKQTMHVYAETPAARFVLIDGHRYREGDQLSGSLQLLEIRRDGTVMQFDGLRFLLPRP